ncbi:MAG: stearoyl-CoA desaturase (delta-9 desaturase) [Gammaproteobacteria bacterium]
MRDPSLRNLEAVEHGAPVLIVNRNGSAQQLSLRMWRWLSNDQSRLCELDESERARLDWFRVVPFVAIHLACFAVVVVGVSPAAVGVAVALYLVRMFFVTAFFHRYFSHRAFRASRPVQFAMGALGCTTGQRGPLWWAGHHRQHHSTSDTILDPHSPAHRGFLFSHTLWFLTRGSFATPSHRVRDWLRFPELRLLERLDWLPFVGLAAGCWVLGAWLESSVPALGTNGPQMLVWGFFISTVALYHATYTINSLAHRFGKRRYQTGDDSRNNFWLALITLGEGWHNNHHYYPSAARQGFFWWEIDLSYLGLRLMARLGLVRDMRPVPPRVLEQARAAGAP